MARSVLNTLEQSIPKTLRGGGRLSGNHPTLYVNRHSICKGSAAVDVNYVTHLLFPPYITYEHASPGRYQDPILDGAHIVRLFQRTNKREKSVSRGENVGAHRALTRLARPISHACWFAGIA